MVLAHRLIEILLFPPGSVLLLGGLGFLLLSHCRRLGQGLMALAFLVLWLFSTPWLSFALLDSLQNQYPPLTRVPESADVIVVLGGGREFGVNEYGRQQNLTLHASARVRYGAFLAKKYGLPIIVSGGTFGGRPSSEAEQAAQILRQEYEVDWVVEEPRSQTTRENALFTSDLMAKNGWAEALLVTESWHMPRSVFSFRQAGVSVVAAATHRDFANVTDRGVWAFFPQAQAMERSRMALHEWLGLLWYWLRA